jgi:hypothetical protein
MRNSCGSEGWPSGISKMIPTPVLSIEFSGKSYAPVGIDDRLFIAEFSKQSPFNAVFLVAAIPAGAAALWALTQVFQTLANFKLNRELIRETIQKLKYEARSHPLLQQADQGHTLELVSRRSRKLNRDMQNSQFAVTSLDIDHIGRQKQAGEDKSKLEERN